MCYSAQLANCLLHILQLFYVYTKTVYYFELSSMKSRLIKKLLLFRPCYFRSFKIDLFHSLNVIECTLGYQYISVIVLVTNFTSPENHCSQVKLLLMLHLNNSCGTINCVVYMTRSKRLDYKCLNKIGEKWKRRKFFFFFLYIQFTLFRTKNVQSPGTFISKHTWDPSQKAITK